MSDRKELYYLIAATLATRLPWVFMVPMWDAPDENTHFYIIKYLAENASLPGPDVLESGGQQSVYVPVPPFGYIPHVLARWSLSGLFDQTVSHRFGSLLLAPVMTYCAWWLGRELFPKNKLLALAVPILIVFHPQLVLVFSYSNNDVTASTLATILLCLAVMNIKAGLTIKRSLIIGVLCGWLMLSKYSGYAVLPAVALSFFLATWIKKSGIKQLLLCILSVIAPAAAITVPWFYRNYQLYNGDFMGTQTMRHRWAVLYNKPLEYYVSPFQILVDRGWWRLMYFSYWGMFGYMTRPLIKPLYWTYVVFLAAGGVGFIKNLVGQNGSLFFKNISARLSRTDSDGPSLEMLAVWLTMFVCTLSNLSAMILASTGNVGGPQGRYLFTSEVPFLAGIVFGLSLLGKVWGKRLVWTFMVFNLIVYIWSFAMLLPIYGGFSWKAF